MSDNTAIERLFFSETLDYFGEYLPNQIGRSDKTIKSYRDSLSVFRRYLLERRGIPVSRFLFSQCDKTLLLEFAAHLQSLGNSPSTCNQRLSAIKSYVWFAADKDISLQSVALSVSRVPQLKVPERARGALRPEALAAMFSMPPATKRGLRDRTILILLYDSAIRLDELLSLTLREANLSDMANPYLRVHGKGNKERIVAITPKTARHVRDYIAAYHADDAGGGSLLFYTTIKQARGKMSEANVERLVKKYAGQARNTCEDIPDRVYPHMFRRTRATELYQSGVSLELVSRMLGHSAIETTRVYATPSTEMLREAIESVENPALTEEKALWNRSEDETAKLYGLR